MRFGHWVVSIVALGTAASGADAKHPYLHFHHALWELREARKEMHEAKHDFGGHREKALHAIDGAIKKLELVLESKEVSDHGIPAAGDRKERDKKYPHHPHLHHALEETKHAHKQMEEAKHHDFGGHKKAALHDMHHAIQQIELCLKQAKK